MKKISTFAGIIALSLGISAYSYSNPNMNGRNTPRPGHERIEMTPEMQQKRIALEEKELSIKKELIKENPNWMQIEKLNKEIANDRAIIKTAKMKQMKENKNGDIKNINRENMPKQRHERVEMTPEMQQKRIAIEEKGLSIKKELIKENPNWALIEKLNKEIANDRATMKTARMKQLKENNNTIKS